MVIFNSKRYGEMSNRYTPVQATEIRHVLAHGFKAIGCGSLLVKNFNAQIF